MLKYVVVEVDRVKAMYEDRLACMAAEREAAAEAAQSAQKQSAERLSAAEHRAEKIGADALAAADALAEAQKRLGALPQQLQVFPCHRVCLSHHCAGCVPVTGLVLMVWQEDFSSTRTSQRSPRQTSNRTDIVHKVGPGCLHMHGALARGSLVEGVHAWYRLLMQGPGLQRMQRLRRPKRPRGRIAGWQRSRRRCVRCWQPWTARRGLQLPRCRSWRLWCTICRCPSELAPARDGLSRLAHRTGCGSSR